MPCDGHGIRNWTEDYIIMYVVIHSEVSGQMHLIVNVLNDCVWKYKWYSVSQILLSTELTLHCFTIQCLRNANWTCFGWGIHMEYSLSVRGISGWYRVSRDGFAVSLSVVASTALPGIGERCIHGEEGIGCDRTRLRYAWASPRMSVYRWHKLTLISAAFACTRAGQLRFRELWRVPISTVHSFNSDTMENWAQESLHVPRHDPLLTDPNITSNALFLHLAPGRLDSCNHAENAIDFYKTLPLSVCADLNVGLGP